MKRYVYRLCCFILLVTAVSAAWGQTTPTSTLTATCTAPCNAPATITLSATTTVASGRAVSKVEFYDGATLLSADTTSPYSITRTAVVGTAAVISPRQLCHGSYPHLRLVELPLANSAETCSHDTKIGSRSCG